MDSLLDLLNSAVLLLVTECIFKMAWNYCTATLLLLLVALRVGLTVSDSIPDCAAVHPQQ